MTMSEGMIRADAVTARDGWLAVAVYLPWYRSLPISCIESIDVAVDGVPVAIRSIAAPGFTGRLGEAGRSDAAWDLRDPIDVTLDVPAWPGTAVPIEVSVAVRIPYIQQAAGIPLVQRAVVRTEAIVS